MRDYSLIPVIFILIKIKKNGEKGVNKNGKTIKCRFEFQCGYQTS